jgi:outer membrane protein OmpA-like peptidoglycan-associated protein
MEGLPGNENTMTMNNSLLLLLLLVPGMAAAQIGITQEAGSIQYVFCDKCPPPTPKVMDLPDPQPVIAAAPQAMVVPVPAVVQVDQERVQFALDSARVAEPDKRALKTFANSLATDTRQIKITGYTDMVGKPARNKRLAVQRADAVKAVLRAAGLKADRMTVNSRCCIENPPRRNPKARRADVEVMP